MNKTVNLLIYLNRRSFHTVMTFRQVKLTSVNRRSEVVIFLLQNIQNVAKWYD